MMEYVFVHKAKDIERRLTVARMGLESITHDMSASGAIHELASKTLTQIAPK